MAAVTVEKDQKSELYQQIKNMKDEQLTDKMKIMSLERKIKEKDFEIVQLKENNKDLEDKLNLLPTPDQQKIFEEYANAETYLKELEEEFNYGMKRIYENEIQFKELGNLSQTFCERFSNLLYNILLIIDF